MFNFRDAYKNTSTIASLDSITTPTYMMLQDTSNTSIPEYREYVSWAVSDVPPAGFASYRILRATSSIGTYGIIKIETNRLINYYTDSNITADTSYDYKVALVDNNGATSYLTSAVNGKANGVQDAGEGGGGTSTAKPTIDETLGTDHFEVTDITSTGATVNWETTNTGASGFGSDSTVEYITEAGGDFSSAASMGVSTLANTTAELGKHIVPLSNLTPNTTYYSQIRSTNPSSELSDTFKYDVNGLRFITTAGPVITNTTAGTPTQSSVTITWDTTDKASDS